MMMMMQTIGDAYFIVATTILTALHESFLESFCTARGTFPLPCTCSLSFLHPRVNKSLAAADAVLRQ